MKNKPESFQQAKPFNTLRSKTDLFERRNIVIKFSCQKMNCLKKPFLAEKPKSINLTQDFLYRKC
jgi:hypothetical protein